MAKLADILDKYESGQMDSAKSAQFEADLQSGAFDSIGANEGIDMQKIKSYFAKSKTTSQSEPETESFWNKKRPGLGKVTDFLKKTSNIPVVSDILRVGAAATGGEKYLKESGLATKGNETLKTAESVIGKTVGVGAALFNPVSGGVRLAAGKTAAKYGVGKLGQAIVSNVATSIPDTLMAGKVLTGESPSAGDVGLGIGIDALIPVGFKGVKWASQAAKSVVDSIASKGLSPASYAKVQEAISSTNTNLKEGFLSLVNKFKNYDINPATKASPYYAYGQNVFKKFTNNFVPQKRRIGEEIGRYFTGNKEIVSGADTLASDFDEALAGLGIKPVYVSGKKVVDSVPDFVEAEMKSNLFTEAGGEGVEAMSKGFGKYRKVIPGLDSLDLPSALKKARALAETRPSKTLDEFINKFGRFDETYQEVFSPKYTADEAFNFLKETAFKVKTEGLEKGVKPMENLLTKESFANSNIQFTPDAQNKLIEVFNAIKKDNLDVESLWRLRLSLDDLLDGGKGLATPLTEASEIPLVAARSKIDSLLKEHADESIKSLMEQYGEMADATYNLSKKFKDEGLGGEALIASLTGKGTRPAETRAAIQSLDKYSGGKTLETAEWLMAAREVSENASATNIRFGLPKNAIWNAATDALYNREAFISKLTEQLESSELAAQLPKTEIEKIASDSFEKIIDVSRGVKSQILEFAEKQKKRFPEGSADMTDVISRALLKTLFGSLD